MTRHEFDPDEHETFVSARLAKLRIQAARVALFDELIDYHLDGDCTFDEAVGQYLHGLEVGGIGYEQSEAA